jgi:group I intron endonuclease
MIHIYLITNEVTGKYYVGQTSLKVHTRFRNHVSAAKTNFKRGCKRLQRSMQKHGSEHFSVQEIGSAQTSEKGNSLETLWIVALDATNREIGYNLCPQGKSTRGFKWSEESKAKLSATNMGNKHSLGVSCSEEKKQKISIALLGHKQSPNSGSFKKGHGLGSHISESHKEALRKAHTGKTVSEETRLRLSSLRKGKEPWNKGLRRVKKWS